MTGRSGAGFRMYGIVEGETVQPPKGQAVQYRPNRTMPLAIGTALLAAMAAFVVFGGSSRKPAAPPLPSGQAAAAKTPADRAARAMPPGERSFIAAIELGRAAYEASPTDTEKAAARSDRAGEICRAVPNPHVWAWSGIIDAASSTAGGRPFVSIEIAPDIRLATQSAADAGAEGSIALDPSVLRDLSTLQPGQAVAFSGSFLPSRPGDADCYRQAIPTPSGAMTAPVFMISLWGINPFPASAPAERSK